MEKQLAYKLLLL